MLFFHFENMWLTHESMEEHIRVWYKYRFFCSPLTQIAKKLRFIKKNLKVWNRELFGLISSRKDDLQGKMGSLEEQIQVQG